MKRFVFSLRPVATLREHRELRAREIFAASLQAVARAEARRDQARQALTRFAESISTRRDGRSTASAEAQTLAGYRRECGVEADAARAVVAARATLERHRQDHHEAHRKLEMIRRLEAKSRAAHRRETARLEQVELDELSFRRHAARPTPSSP